MNKIGKISNTEQLCYECESNKYINDNTCVDDCHNYSKKNPNRTAPEYNYCISCPDDQLLQNNECVNYCDKTNLYFLSDVNKPKVCIKCNDLVFDEACVKSCPPKYKEELNKCVCDTTNNVILNGQCLTSCPPNLNYYIGPTKECLKCDITTHIYNNDNQECYQCKDKGLYFYNNQCVSTCPLGYRVNSNQTECEPTPNCKENYKVLFGNKCLETCPDGYYLLEEETENSCYFSCPVGYINNNFNTSLLQCTKCQYYLQDGICVDKCKEYYGPNSNKLCDICKNTSNIYILDSLCVEKCPDRYTYGNLFSHENLCYLENNNINNCVNNSTFCENNSNCNNVTGLCNCQDGNFGDRCDLGVEDIDAAQRQINELLIDISNISLENISSDQIDQILKLSNMIGSTDALQNDEFNKVIMNLAYSIGNLNSIEGMEQSVFKLLDSAVSISDASDESKLSDIVNKVTKMVKIVPTNSTLLYSGASLTIDVSGNSETSKIFSRNNKLAIVDFKQCEALLKSNNILAQNESLFSINSNMKVDNMKVSSNLVDSKGNSVNTTLCKSIQILIPSSFPNVDEYLKIKNETGVDIYNSTDPFFNDICVSFQGQNGTDITVGARQSKYNTTASCSKECQYKGLDEHSWTICDCASISAPAYSFTDDSVFKALIDSNINLIFCYDKAFDKDIILGDYGFWYYLGLTLLITTIAIVQSIYLNSNKLLKNMNKVIYNDAINIDGIEEVIKDNARPQTSGVGNNNKKKNTKVLTIIDVPEVENNQDNNHIAPKTSKLKNNNKSLVSPSRTPATNILSINNFTLSNSPVTVLAHSKASDDFTSIKNTLNAIKRQSIGNYKEVSRLPASLQIKADPRTFQQYLYDEFTNRHDLFSLFNVYSITKPFFVKIFMLLSEISTSSALSAIFFSPKYIDKQSDSKLSQKNIGFIYIITNEFIRMFWPALIAFVLSLLLHLIIYVPRTAEIELTVHMKERA